MVLHALLLAVFHLAHSLIRVCAYIADPRSAGAPPQAWRTYGLPIYLALLLPLLLAISLPLVGELRRELGGAPAQELPLAAPRWLSTRSQLRSQLKSRFGQISTALSAAPHRLPWLEDAMRGLWGGLLRQKDTVGDLGGGVMRAGGEGSPLAQKAAARPAWPTHMRALPVSSSVRPDLGKIGCEWWSCGNGSSSSKSSVRFRDALCSEKSSVLAKFARRLKSRCADCGLCRSESGTS